jgi:uncharacterized protein (TIGR04222 family)
VNENELSLWLKIEAFRLDEPDAPFPFSRKLARENSWEPGYAARATREYRRFLYLYCCAPHPVSPSDVVDQVWHLHLTYTQSYWNQLCRETLGRPLHHVPSQGQPGEGEKFSDWYRQTLESYVAHFHETPPADIWPTANTVGSSGKPRHRRVDLGRHWVIPRPRNLFWTAGVAACGLTLLTIAGCNAGDLGPDILNLRGPVFLSLYWKLTTAFLAVALTLRFVLRAPAGAVPDIADDPYLYAWLADGPKRVTYAALAHLSKLEVVKINSSKQVKPGSNLNARGLHPLEQALVAHTRTGGATMDSWICEVEICGSPMAEELESKGLVLPPRARGRARWRPLLIALIPAVLGVTKIGVGISRGKPVGFLMMLTAATIIVAFVTVGRRVWQSRRGAALLSKLTNTHSALKDLRQPNHVSTCDPMLLSIALFGPVVLHTTTFAHLAPLMGSRIQSTDSSTSCGSSCGGGGGGGGGGCGGCSGD